MADLEYLKKCGIEIPKKYQSKATTISKGMSNKEVIHSIIDNYVYNFWSRSFDYLRIGFGICLFADGLVNTVFPIMNNKDFNSLSVLELALGTGLTLWGIKSRSRKDAVVKKITDHLIDQYVED